MSSISPLSPKHLPRMSKQTPQRAKVLLTGQISNCCFDPPSYFRSDAAQERFCTATRPPLCRTRRRSSVMPEHAVSSRGHQKGRVRVELLPRKAAGECPHRLLSGSALLGSTAAPYGGRTPPGRSPGYLGCQCLACTVLSVRGAIRPKSQVPAAT